VAIPSPSPGQARALESIAGLISLGHDQLGGRKYIEACESFRRATSKALDLMP
jgi:hypothetical protein